MKFQEKNTDKTDKTKLDAVSVLKILFPNPTSDIFESIAFLHSVSDMPPSGPIIKPIDSILLHVFKMFLIGITSFPS